MNKLYNTQSKIVNKIREYLKKCNKFTKKQLNIIPEILFWYDFNYISGYL